MEKKDIPLNEQIMCDVDDMVCDIRDKIKKKYKLSEIKAIDKTNWALRVLMMGYPEEWLKE
jgi:hypothetical protein